MREVRATVSLRLSTMRLLNNFLIIRRCLGSNLKYRNYETFELREGVAFRHHGQERIAELRNSFAPITVGSVVYKTMNGNRSKGLYYLGRYGANTGASR